MKIQMRKLMPGGNWSIQINTRRRHLSIAFYPNLHALLFGANYIVLETGIGLIDFFVPFLLVQVQWTRR